MSWITIIWSICAGIFLAMAGLNLLVWLRARGRWANFFFSLSAVGAAASAVIELALMYAQTPADTGFWLRWMHTSVQVCVIALIWFVRAYLGAGSLWLAWLSCGLRALTLVINFLPGHANVAFREMKPPRQIVALGESVSVPDGIGTGWSLLVSGASVLFLVYLVGAVIAAWRQGNRRRAGWLGVAVSLSFLLGMTQTRLVTAGLLSIPYTMSLLFLPILSIMGIELSSDLLRAFVLSRALQESQERIKLAAKAVDLGFWEWDIAKDEIWATEAGRARVGAGEFEPINFDRFLRSVHPEDREATRQAVQRSVDSAVDLEVEYRMITTDGRLRWIATHGYVITKDNGAPHLIRGISFDITARKKAEIEGIQLRLEVAHLGRVMTMSELSTYLAHEINQPLGAILNNATAARIQCSQRREGGEGEVVEIMDDIIRDTTRAAEIVRKIRGIIKKDNLAFEPLNINVLIEEVVELFSNPLTRENILIRTDLFPDLTQVRGDRVRLQQVLMNLLTNAIDAMKDSSTRILTIRTTMQGPDMVVVSFCDTGSGLYEKAGDMVFQSFYTTKKEGLGMGLRICRSIIEEHGGRIGAENNPDGGATFIFTLKADSVGTA